MIPADIDDGGLVVCYMDAWREVDVAEVCRVCGVLCFRRPQDEARRKRVCVACVVATAGLEVGRA